MVKGVNGNSFRNFNKLNAFFLGIFNINFSNFLKQKKIFLIFLVPIFLIAVFSAAPILDQLHLNIQTTDSNGNVITGTYNFAFNISTDVSCASIVYSNRTTLTTDSRGIISYYLENTNLDYDSQYYLCYYRDEVLIETSEIARTPYSFTAQNVTTSGLIVDSNLNLGSYNLTANYLFGDGRYLTNLNTSAINVSGVNYWVKSGSNLYYNDGNVGIGTTSPGAYRLNIAGGGVQVGSSYSYDINNGATSFDVDSIGSYGNLPFSIITNNTARVYVTGAGNVGIGTTGPNAKLHVNGDTKVDGAINVTSSGTQFRVDSGGDVHVYLG